MKTDQFCWFFFVCIFLQKVSSTELLKCSRIIHIYLCFTIFYTIFVLFLLFAMLFSFVNFLLGTILWETLLLFMRVWCICISVNYMLVEYMYVCSSICSRSICVSISASIRTCYTNLLWLMSETWLTIYVTVKSVCIYVVIVMKLQSCTFLSPTCTFFSRIFYHLKKKLTFPDLM